MAWKKQWLIIENIWENIFSEEIIMLRITANPNILGGKPIIKGTRISVEFILQLLASHVTEDEIILDYPHLSKEDIQACLIYAADALKNEIYIDIEKAA